MKIAIMQPYFFPYIGYFSLIKHTDRFILLDTVQFIRHGWIERNRILKQDDGWLYIKVPLLKKHRKDLIMNIGINNGEEWKRKIISQLEPYKRKAPNYFKVIEIINEIFDKEYENIVDLNFEILKRICNYLEIKNEISIFSKMNLIIGNPMAADEWALNICKSLGNVSEYWNPPGGQSFFNKEKYDQTNIKLKFQKVSLCPYDQNTDFFESGLSIIDVMMFNSVQEINIMLDEYILN